MLLDEHILLSHYKESMDWNYIKKEAKYLEIDEYEKNLRHLAGKIFANDSDMNYILENELKTADSFSISKKLTPAEKQVLYIMLTQGTYGTVDNYTKNRLKDLQEAKGKTGKIFAKVKYIKNRLYPEGSGYRKKYSFFYEHKIFYPLLPVYRLGLSLIKRRQLIVEEIKAIFKY